MSDVYALLGKGKTLICIFDTAELCMAWCNKQGKKEYTFYMEYLSSSDRDYLIGPGAKPDYIITKEEIFTGNIDDFPVYNITFECADGSPWPK